MDELLLLGVGCLGGLFIGSQTEYWVHIFMHKRILLGHSHIFHHEEPWDEHFFQQYKYYLLGWAPMSGAFILGFWAAGYLLVGLGIAAGGFLWATWVAYAHTLQHEKPELVFWMRRPIHYIHHTHHLPGYNFGLSVDWWDHVFGTYKAMPWTCAPRPRWWGLHLLSIHWFKSPPSPSGLWTGEEQPKT